MFSDTAETVACSSLSEFPRIVITSLIEAMKFGSHEARFLFPRLLQIIAQFPNTVNDFIRCVCVSCLLTGLQIISTAYICNVYS